LFRQRLHRGRRGRMVRSLVVAEYPDGYRSHWLISSVVVVVAVVTVLRKCSLLFSLLYLPFFILLLLHAIEIVVVVVVVTVVLWLSPSLSQSIQMVAIVSPSHVLIDCYLCRICLFILVDICSWRRRHLIRSVVVAGCPYRNRPYFLIMSVVVVFVDTIPRKFWLIVVYSTLAVDCFVGLWSLWPSKGSIVWWLSSLPYFASSRRLLVVFTISAVFYCCCCVDWGRRRCRRCRTIRSLFLAVLPYRNPCQSWTLRSHRRCRSHPLEEV